MTKDAHIAIVTLVNRVLGSPFPATELRKGAIAPDVNRGTDKHHYDDRPHSTKRRGKHEITIDIRDEVWKARRCVLVEDFRQAAFHFGVGSHYLLDGLIVSPAVDYQAHARVEGQLSRLGCRLNKLQVPPNPLSDSQYAERSLEEASVYFGSNQKDALVKACAVLVRLGQAVAEERTPLLLLARGQHIIDEFRAELSATAPRSFEWLKDTLERMTRDVLSKPLRWLRVSDRAVRRLAVIGLLRRRAPFLVFRYEAFIWWRALRKIDLRFRPRAREALGQAAGMLRDVALRAVRAVGQRQFRDPWFDLRRAVNKWKSDIQQKTDEALSELRMRFTEASKKFEMRREQCLQRALEGRLEGLMRSWRRTLRYRLGCWSIYDDSATLVWLSLPILLAMLVATALTVALLLTKTMNLLVAILVAIIGACLLFGSAWLLLAPRMLKRWRFLAWYSDLCEERNERRNRSPRMR